MTKFFTTAALVATGLFGFAGSANAVPLASATSVAKSNTLRVDVQAFRCHGPGWDRRCHGPRILFFRDTDSGHGWEDRSYDRREYDRSHNRDYDRRDYRGRYDD